ncbi:SCO family protein [Pyxidicoccus sp. 3LFB2]
MAALLIATGCQRGASAEFAVVPVRPAPRLEAPRASGEVFRLGDQRGRVVLVSFGYTACPDVCPTTLSQLNSLYKRLGNDAQGVEMVFVSVDPERDSTPRLEEYVRAFNPRFTGLRVEGEALSAVLSAWQVTASRRYPDAARYREHRFSGSTSYTVDHTGAFFVIDKRGALRLRLPYTIPVEQMQAEVARLLAEEG